MSLYVLLMMMMMRRAHTRPITLIYVTCVLYLSLSLSLSLSIHLSIVLTIYLSCLGCRRCICGDSVFQRMSICQSKTEMRLHHGHFPASSTVITAWPWLTENANMISRIYYTCNKEPPNTIVISSAPVLVVQEAKNLFQTHRGLPTLALPETATPTLISATLMWPWTKLGDLSLRCSGAYSLLGTVSGEEKAHLG